MRSLFQLGNFVLNSGAVSKWRLECDALTVADIDALAFMLAKVVGPFGSVEGVPRGGLLLATALQEYADVGSSFVPLPHVIVNDVLTTGGSMERLRKSVANSAGCMPSGAEVVGAVVFARGLCPPWVKPLFQMAKELWL